MARSRDERFYDRITALEAGRAREATAQQRWATGASSGGGMPDPIDGDYGFRRIGKRGPRDVPERTREQARTDSIAGYRSNPMARAIIDTYVAFCVGDSGVTATSSSPEVREAVTAFWRDPRNMLGARQELMLRTWLLQGESAYELLVAQLSGVTRFSPIDPSRVRDVRLHNGNALWPESLVVRMPDQDDLVLTVVAPDEMTGLLTGDVLWWPGFKAVDTDTRGTPFLMPVIDWLDSYDQVLSNLIDRTALARYMVWDVTVDGDGQAVDDFVAQRGGRHAPRSGTVEVHNQGVEWKPMTAESGADEDTVTNKAVLTNIAGGAGLSKVWLAEPEDANRATSLTMAEPVRRRIGSVQNEWLAHMAELTVAAVDQLVARGRLPELVEIAGEGGQPMLLTPAETVQVTGPQIAAADASITAKVLVDLSQSLTDLVAAQLLSREAATLAAKKAWEQFTGTPYRPELDRPDADVADVATAVQDAGGSIPGLTAA